MGWLIGKNKTTVVNGAVDLVKGIRKMVDDTKFTSEEAARMNIEAANAISQFAKDTLTENTDRSKTRRQIATFYIYFFCGLVVSVIGIWKFESEWAEFALKIIDQLSLGWAFIAVIAFFFGAHLMRQYTGQSKK